MVKKDFQNKKIWLLILVLGFFTLLININFVSAADCNEATCAGLGGHCEGNWCIPNSEILNPVGEWTFDDSTARDSSGFENHGTLTNGASIVTAPNRGQVLFLEGVDDYVGIPDSPSLSPTTAMTISLWVKQDTLDPVRTIASKWDYPSKAGWALEARDTQLYIILGTHPLDSGANLAVTPLGSWTSGAFHHIAFTYGGDGVTDADKLKVYIDGVEQQLTFYGFIPRSLQDNDVDLNIGYFPGLGRFWNGNLDEIKIYNRALTAREIVAEFTGCSDGPNSDPDLISWWEGESNTCDSENGNPGLEFGGVTYGPGQDGNAFSFDGVDDYIDLGTSSNFNFDDFTLSAWVNVNPADNTDDKRLISNDDYTSDTDSNREVYVLLTSSISTGAGGIPALIILKQDNPAFRDYVNAADPLTNGWHHLAGVRSGNTLLMYVDGVLSSSKITTITETLSPESSLVISGISPTLPGQFFKGSADEIKIYNRALTAAEILKLVNPVTLPEGVAGVTGTVTLTGGAVYGDEIRVDGGAGGGTVDFSANGNDLRLFVPRDTQTMIRYYNQYKTDTNGANLKILSTTAGQYDSLSFESILGETELDVNDPFSTSLSTLGKRKIGIFFDSTLNMWGAKAGAENTIPLDVEFGEKFEQGQRVMTKLHPSEDIRWGETPTLSGQDVLEIGTTTGLFAPIKLFQEGAEANFRLGSNSGIKIFHAVRGIDAKKIFVALPMEGEVKLESSTIIGHPMRARKKQGSSFSPVGSPERHAKYRFLGSAPYLVFEVNENTFFNSYLDRYSSLSPTGANGINAVLLTSEPLTQQDVEITYNGLTQRKNIVESEAFNFMEQKDKLGNIVTVAGKSSIFSGSLLEVISPEAIIEGWNSFYAATDNNYWNWNVALESLPSGCTADKESASETVDSEIKTITFYVDCSGGSSLTTGSVVSGFAPVGFKKAKLGGQASMMINAEDCVQRAGGKAVCKPAVQKRISSQVIKGKIAPGMTGSTILSGLDSGNISIIISLLTLIGIIVLLFLIERKRTLYK